MDGPDHLVLHPFSNGPGALRNPSYSSSSGAADEQAAPTSSPHRPRKPSGLQTNMTATMVEQERAGHAPHLLASPMDSPRSPRDRLDDFLRQQDPSPDTTAPRPQARRNVSDSSSSPPKPQAQSYAALRNVSTPSPFSQPAAQLGNASPPSPRARTSPAIAPTASVRADSHQNLRNPSIDSQMSMASMATSNSSKTSPSSTTSPTSDLSALIRAAGSPEALVQKLLREKQQTDARCTQLWNVVEKQSKFIWNLKQDLEGSVKDVERYRERNTALQDRISGLEAEAVQHEPKTAPPALAIRPHQRSPSPAPSDSSADLPIQRQSVNAAELAPSPEDVRTPRTLQEVGMNIPPAKPQYKDGVESSGDWIDYKRKGLGAHHGHKQTSSSDLGVFTGSRSGADDDEELSAPLRARLSPTRGFAAKRTQINSSNSLPSQSPPATEASTFAAEPEHISPPRKAPPAPLNLGGPRTDDTPVTTETHEPRSASEYDSDSGDENLPTFERGRKQTREDDDLEREVLLRKQQKKSRSKKSSASRSQSSKAANLKDSGLPSPAPAESMPVAVKAVLPQSAGSIPQSSVALNGAAAAQPASLAGLLNEPYFAQNTIGGTDNIVPRAITAKAPLSPGLPLSPRPADRPVNPPTPRLPRDPATASLVSPPLSAKVGAIGLPLSPRHPKQSLPLPPHTPMSMPPSSPMFNSTEPRELQQAPSESRPATAPTIFKGLMTDAYPNLLLPPNALPSIAVTVISSRLKPSRHSLILRGSEEEPVFTLGVSARFDRKQLWIIEKPISSLLQLDQQLRQFTRLDIRLPDRSLFSGHAPAKIDARTLALEQYFEQLLDTPLDEKAAVAVCQYLSANASAPFAAERSTTPRNDSPTQPSADGPIVKQGYLTKRGKNFGGWKARYFILDEPILRYYEAAGGSVLGTIKLYRAQIGRQAPPKSSNSGDESDSQFRHAFLIREPKRKDSSSFVDHVLCAENDAERDAWVEALMGYVGMPEGVQSSSPKAQQPAARPPLRQPMQSRSLSDSEDFNSLQGVPYEEMKAAKPPQVHIIPDPLPDNESPSPTTPGSIHSDRAPSVQSRTISGPQNGVKISDAGAWGNKPPSSPLLGQQKDTNSKKRSLFGFHSKDSLTAPTASNPSNASDSSLGLGLSQSQQHYQETVTNVRAAFGAPLAEAVESCPPRGISTPTTYLPAVVYRCLQYLEAKQAVLEEGIFRMSGSNTLIKNLKNRFNVEGDFDLLASGQWYDVHAVASLLKQYLRELPSTILTKELHMSFLAVIEMKDDTQKIPAYNRLVHALPQANFHLLRALAQFLVQVVQNSDSNKMDIRNVGIVFSPTLNIPTPIIVTFLTEFDAVFGQAITSPPPPPAIAEPAAQAGILGDEIRSPRKQMFTADLSTPGYNQTSFPPDTGAVMQNGTRQGPGDMGFVPLQPSSSDAQQQQHLLGVDASYISRPRNLGPGSSAKQSRRESSMLFMGPPGGTGAGAGAFGGALGGLDGLEQGRKRSLPTLRSNDIDEDG